MNSRGIGKATGKIILVGEHAVVYGQPAIAIPFNQTTILSTTTFTNKPITISCHFFSGLLDDAPAELDGVKQLIFVTLAFLKKPIFGLDIKIESTIPIQRGLGSSAAVSLAVIRSLFDAFDTKLTKESETYLTDIAEKIHHISPSGIDAETIIAQEAIMYDKTDGMQTIDLNIKGFLVVADSGHLGLSKDALDKVKQKYSQKPADVEQIFERLGEITHATKKCLKDGQIDSLGQLLSEAHQLLSQVNVSNSALDNLVNAAINAGALGAKLTGSGLGGCVIAVAKDFASAQKIKNAFEQSGAVNTWIYDLKQDLS